MKDEEGHTRGDKKRALFIYNVIGRRRGRAPPTVPAEERGTRVQGRDPPEMGGGSSRLGKKAGRSDVVTGVLRSAGAPAVGTDAALGA